MYITDTGALQAHGGPAGGQNISVNPRLPASIYSYDVVDEGTRLANRQMFAYIDAGVPDGIKCDEAGNVYSGCGDGVSNTVQTNGRGAYVLIMPSIIGTRLGSKRNSSW